MMPSRRSVLQAGAAVITAVPVRKPRVAVIGAGAFGGWTALHLLRQGVQVTLLDAWGPGNSRASSGGETRIIRATYGPDRVYVQMVVRSLALWREHEKRWNRPHYRQIGCLRMPGKDDRYEKAAVPIMRNAGLTIEELTPREARKRWPQINFDGISWILYEKDAGFLTARRNCEAVLSGFLKEGGEYKQLAVTPGPITRGQMQGLTLSDQSKLTADFYVFACGPWLGKLFPDVVGDRIHSTRQEVFFFGTPAGDPRFLEDRLPAWIDDGDPHFYGIPGNEWRGFKIADDGRGPLFDPTSGDRTPSADGVRAARKYLDFRFPGMKGAPLVEARVCQYENSPDHHFILDRHPGAQNVWLVGGGSGHGYKMGPGVGERVAEMVLGKRPLDRFFSLGRL
ncbi:MAG: FAD-dependent oxidoreductase, partial [Acidobacteria bacterium]|nr:FAD-dependent oxidoreductase [Acidobacteriota bacterium]